MQKGLNIRCSGVPCNAFSISFEVFRAKESTVLALLKDIHTHVEVRLLSKCKLDKVNQVKMKAEGQLVFSVADEEFRREGALTPEGGTNLLFDHFSRKLHKNKARGTRLSPWIRHLFFSHSFLAFTCRSEAFKSLSLQIN